MIGAIAGDVIGSMHEAGGYKLYDFPLFTEWSKFTDDTVVTIAVAQAILEDRDYQEVILEVCRRYPRVGYGQSFERWLSAPEIGAYESWGNGAAMRVSPIGFSASTEGEILDEAKKSVEMTHNHEEGIKGAQATALCIFRARQAADKADIREEIQKRFGYDLTRTVEEIRPSYTFDVACEKSVPESIICFLDATDYESTIRNVVSLGGDTDTMACIAGGIAQAYWNDIPEEIIDGVRELLPKEFLNVIDRFSERYGLTEL